MASWKRWTRRALATVAPRSVMQGGAALRILTYHRVNSLAWDRVGVRTQDFERQICYLRDHYDVLGSEALLCGDCGTSPNLKFLITFDDGYKDNLLEAAPVLEKYKVPATFFVATDYIGGRTQFPWDARRGHRFEFLTVDDLRQMARLGHAIGSHTCSHRDLAQLTIDETEKELSGSRKRLEDWLGKETNAFAYPFGRKANLTREVGDLVRRNFQTSFVAIRGPNPLPLRDRHDLRRVSVHGEWSFREFVAGIEGRFDFVERLR